MPTINEVYRDAVLRHQVDVRRYTAGVNKQVAALLEKADAELVEKLRARLAKFEGKPLDVTSERWKALLADIRDWRQSAIQDYKDLTRKELGNFSVHEGQANTTMLNDSVGLVGIEFASVAASQLRAIITSQPFQGRLLNDWFNTLEAADQARLVQAIQLGMTQGETIDDIVRRVVGTREAGYADGILSVTRRDAQGIVRTAVNFVSNEARDSVLEENDDIVTAKIWVSTLDGRTTPICQANDGKGTPIGNNELPKSIQPLQPPGITPPAHFNCRSTMVGYIDGVGLVGKRPYVSDTRTRKSREADFEAEAAATGRPIQDIRQDWADANVGEVPSATNYNDWLKGQSSQFQDEVLGPTRGKLFREGGVTLDQFMDRSGNELTLAQLKDRLLPETSAVDPLADPVAYSPSNEYHGLWEYQDDHGSLTDYHVKTENKALHEYVGPTHSYINDYLRELERIKDPTAEGYVSELTKMFSPTTQDYTLFRSIGGSYGKQLFSSLEVGDVVSDAGFTSTSRSIRVALDFTGNSTKAPTFVFRYPMGRQAIITNIEEVELILPPNVKFRVVRITNEAIVNIAGSKAVVPKLIELEVLP